MRLFFNQKLQTLHVIAASLFCVAMPAISQEDTAQVREKVQIGLSTDTIAITSGFSGTDLTIFGAVENSDPSIVRQGNYDIIVVLEGPPRATVVRRKDRVLGLWINTVAESFDNVPVSYSMATTRPIQDITTDASYRQLALGAHNLSFNVVEAGRPTSTVAEFATALRTIKDETGLYNSRIGGVRFLSQNLFRAALEVPASVPVGTHRARAFLFRNGVFIDEMSAPLVIVKSGMEAAIFRAARDSGLYYGIFAVFLAMLTGWLGRVIFKRD